MRVQSSLSLAIVVAAGLSTQIPWALAQQPRPAGATQVGSDAVLMWNAAASAAAMKACISPIDNPFHESRIYAVMHVAIHDALNAITAAIALTHSRGAPSPALLQMPL
jgi:hypothetical protein